MPRIGAGQNRGRVDRTFNQDEAVGPEHRRQNRSPAQIEAVFRGEVAGTRTEGHDLETVAVAGDERIDQRDVERPVERDGAGHQQPVERGRVRPAQCNVEHSVGGLRIIADDGQCAERRAGIDLSRGYDIPGN